MTTQAGAPHSAGASLEGLPAFTAALGQRLRRARAERGWTAEDVARYARGVGLRWDRSLVAGIETGRRNVSAAELLLLPVIYARPLVDLLPDERVRLSDKAAPSPEALRDALTEAPDLDGDGWLLTGYMEPPPNVDVLLARGARVLQEITSRFPDAPLGSLKRADQHANDEPTSKAARKLGVDRQVVAVAAEQLWGHGLAAERDRRVDQQGKSLSPRALQAARGHITRALLGELQELLANPKDGAR